MDHFHPHLRLLLKNDFQESLYCNNPSKLGCSEKMNVSVHRRLQKQTEDFYERSLEILEDDTNDKIYETFRKPKQAESNQARNRWNNRTTAGDQRVVGDVTSPHKPLPTERKDFERIINNFEHIINNDRKIHWKENVYSNGEMLQDCSNHTNAFDNDSYACFNAVRDSQSSNLASNAFKDDSVYFATAVSQNSQQLTDKLQFEMNGDAPRAPLNSCYESLAETYSDSDKTFHPKCSREMQLIWSISNNLQSEDGTDEPMFSQSTINSMNSLLRLPSLNSSSDWKSTRTSQSSTNRRQSIEPVKNSLSSSKSHKDYQNLQELCLEFASSKITRRSTNKRQLAKTSTDESEYLTDSNKFRLDKADESLSLTDYSVECLEILDRQPRKEKIDLYFDHYFDKRYYGNPSLYEYTRYCRINENCERTKADLTKTREAILSNFTEKHDANISNGKKLALKFESPTHEMQSHGYSCWSELDSSSTVSTVKSCPDIASADESIEPLYDQILSDCVANNYKLSREDAKRFFENCETDSDEVFYGVKNEAGIRHHSTANWDTIDSNFSNIYINET